VKINVLPSAEIVQVPSLNRELMLGEMLTGLCQFPPASFSLTTIFSSSANDTPSRVRVNDGIAHPLSVHRKVLERKRIENARHSHVGSDVDGVLDIFHWQK
jgi:hypothetical protein